MASKSEDREKEPEILDLSSLTEGRPGITESWGASLAETAAICLHEQTHDRGVVIEVSGFYNDRFRVIWPEDLITNQAVRTWADREEATEHGACGIAALVIEKLTGRMIVERAMKGDGFDYWLGTDPFPFEEVEGKLEVSGIRQGKMSVIKKREREKLNQVRPSADSLPVFVVVVEFGKPLCRVVRK